jgi:hypothetical protein
MAKAEKRLTVDVEAKYYVDFEDFNRKTPEEIIETMKALREEVGDADVYYYIESYGYDGGKELKLRQRRLENDKEYAKRMADEKKVKDKVKADKAAKEAREFAEYKRLQKKFQGKSVFNA